MGLVVKSGGNGLTTGYQVGGPLPASNLHLQAYLKQRSRQPLQSAGPSAPRPRSHHVTVMLQHSARMLDEAPAAATRPEPTRPCYRIPTPTSLPLSRSFPPPPSSNASLDVLLPPPPLQTQTQTWPQDYSDPFGFQETAGAPGATASYHLAFRPLSQPNLCWTATLGSSQLTLAPCALPLGKGQLWYYMSECSGNIGRRLVSALSSGWGLLWVLGGYESGRQLAGIRLALHSTFRPGSLCNTSGTCSPTTPHQGSLCSGRQSER